MQAQCFEQRGFAHVVLTQKQIDVTELVNLNVVERPELTYFKVIEKE